MIDFFTHDEQVCGEIGFPYDPTQSCQAVENRTRCRLVRWMSMSWVGCPRMSRRNNNKARFRWNSLKIAKSPPIWVEIWRFWIEMETI